MESITNDPFAWLHALIGADDFRAAELLTRKLPPDFEKVYALLYLAEAYHKYGKHEKARSCASQAVTVWNLGLEEWWLLPMLGDLLRMLVDCAQPGLAERIIDESVSLVEGVGHDWFETHGWCGLAQGSACMGQRERAEGYFERAILVAESRSTDEERSSAMSIVEFTLQLVNGSWDNLSENRLS